MRDHPHPRKPHVKEGGVRMENKTKILAFAAVALMFAVCFIGFVAINDDAVDADETTTNVASVKIGDVTTGYATIEEAVEAAQSSDSGNIATITLLKDVTTNKTLSFTKSGQYTLDIGEYTLTQGGDGYMISVGGSASPAYPIDTINTSAQITIKGTGNIITNNTTFRSYGTMIFGENGVGPTVTMSNSVNSHSTFKVGEGSSLMVNGGTFNLSSDPSNKVTRLMQNFGTTVINNGTFNGDIELWSYTKSDGTKYDSTVTINEGTFNGKLLRQSDSDSQFVLDDEDKFIVEGGSFTDIANAVKYATSGATITLLKDVDVTEDVTVSNVITIDLNKNKVSFNKSHLIVNGELTLTNGTFESKAPVEQSSAISVKGESSKIAKLTLENVEIISAEAKSSDEYSGYGIFAAAYSEVTVNKGTKITADYAAISGNGSASGENLGIEAKITINGGTFESRKATCIYFPNTSTLIVRGGTFTGASGFEIRAGTNVNISGATINVKKDVTLGVADSGKSPLGVAFAIVCSNAYGKDTDMNVTIGKDNVLNLDDECFAFYLGSAMPEAKYLTKDDIYQSAVDTGKGSMTINYNLNESEKFTIVQSSDKKMPSMLIDKDGKIVACSDKITGLSGTITLVTDKDVTLSNLEGDITVKGKVGALTITGSGNESVSVELDSAKTLCISNVKDVTVDECTFTTDSYVKGNGGESVVNISNVKEKVSVKNVTINANKDVKGQGISIMNCTEVKRIVISDNKIYNAGHHSIMIGSVFKKLETLDITNNTFSEWGCKIEYSSAMHMFGKADSSVKATISNNTFTCEMKDSSRLGKIISIGYQNGNEDGDSMGAFENPVIFTKNVVNGKATDDFNLVVERGATTYLDFGTKYAGNAISLSVRQNGINHKAISYGDFTIVSTDVKMMDIGEEGSIVINGTVTCEGIIKTTATDKLDIKGKLIMKAGSTLTVGSANIIGTGAFDLKTGELEINTNSKGGFDATLNGKATASKLDVWINDTFTVAKGAELTMTGTFLNAGNVTIDGTLLMTDAGKLQVMKNGIVTINGTIDGGIIDITNVDKDIVCVLFKPNSTITSKIDGTVDGKTSIVVLFGIKAGKGGVSVMKGSVIVDGALVEGDVTVPSGSTSFVYGTLEPGATLTIENNAAVNPTGSGSLVVESGAKVVTNSGASIKSVTYKAGSELNGTTFDTDTRVTPEGNVLVAIKIYLNYDDKKLNVSADYVEAFAGDKYVDVLSGVTVSGVNSRITFSGWYNSLDEKITSDVVVPSGGADVILTAHFTEKAKNTVINTGSNDGVDYSVVIAFIVLIGSMVFLCSVLRKR